MFLLARELRHLAAPGKFLVGQTALYRRGFVRAYPRGVLGLPPPKALGITRVRLTESQFGTGYRRGYVEGSRYQKKGRR